MRLFFAVYLPVSVSCALNGARQALAAMPNARVVRPELMHITVSFLGEVPRNDVPSLIAAARKVRVHPGIVSLNGRLHGFPRDSNWKVAVAGIEDKAEVLTHLNSQLPKGEQHERRYVPHITLARSNNEQLTLPQVLIGALSFEVTEFYLVESLLGAGGPRYQIIQSFTL